MIQGEDIQVRITLKDGTTVIQPSTLNAYSVNVYYIDEFGVKQNLATYKSVNTGLYGIVVFSNVLGKIDIIINRELTKTMAGNKIYAEVYIKSNVTSDFILSKSVNGTALYLFTMETSSNSSAV